MSALSSNRYWPRPPSPHRPPRQRSPAPHRKPRLRLPSPHPNMCSYHARFGDRGGQHVKATDVAGPHHSRLFFITDRDSGLRFLIDTGAQVSVIPPSATDRRSPSTLTLQAVNNTSIRTYGSRSLTLNLCLRHTFRWVFVGADVTNAILGADFLLHYQLMVDLGHRRFVDAVTCLHVQRSSATLHHHSPPSRPLILASTKYT